MDSPLVKITSNHHLPPQSFQMQHTTLMLVSAEELPIVIVMKTVDLVTTV